MPPRSTPAPTDDGRRRLVHPARLAAVRATGLLDAPEEPRLSAIAARAAALLDAPVALVTLVDAERQVLAGTAGLADDALRARLERRHATGCALVVAEEAPVALDDLAAAPRRLALPAGLRAAAYLGVPLRDGDGVVLGACAVLDVVPRAWTPRDVATLEALAEAATTALVLRAELARRDALEAQLRQAQKMEPVGQLAGGVAHDFNNLLMVVGGNAEFLRARLRGAGLPLDELDELDEAVRRATALTRQLLAFSRKQQRAPRPVDLAAHVGSLDRLLRRVIGEDVALVPDLPDAPLVVDADPAHLEQVVLNLVVNARDAIQEARAVGLAAESVIELRLDVRSLDEARAATLALAPGPYAALTVRDGGIGIDPALQGRIFEPFFTTKAQGRGTGLGLATAYGIVRQHRGAIELVSAPGTGSTFTVWLPLGAGTPLPDAAASDTAAPAATGETVLLVEDEAAVRATVRRMLERAGYAVLEAKHGVDALARLAQVGIAAEGGRIAAVLSDVVMPEMGAAALVPRLRAGWPALPIVLMSGYSELAVSGELLTRHGLDILAKPFEPAELARVLFAALRAAGAAGVPS